ncbi:MAG: N-acetylmuramoyl-L-alanine amidase [Symbiopectobacterium sp.]
MIFNSASSSTRPDGLKLLTVCLLALIVTGCSTPRSTLVDRGDYIVDTSHPSKAQNERVRFLILHYTALDDAHSLEMLTQEQVSAHYLVAKNPPLRDKKPVVMQLVPENMRAWHAGVSNWNDRVNLNDSSVGIEIVNRGFTDNMLGARTWYPYNEVQITALAALTKDIIKRNNITPDNILAHSDIAPLRKQDPGKLFPWKRFAEMGVGAWPDDATVNKYLAGRQPSTPTDVLTLQKALHQYGYDKIPQKGELDKETRLTISAFQMHFRQSDIEGNADAQTEAIAKALVEKYRT